MSEKGAIKMIEDFSADSFDWEDMVRKHPLSSLLLAAVGGFVLARTRGEVIMAALSGYAATQVSRHVNELLGDEIL